MINNLFKIKLECPICRKTFDGVIGEHIRSQHGEREFRQAVLEAKERGMPDQEIGILFGITFKQLEEIITETYGINISVLKKPKKIKYWEPKNFREETTTVWSFKQRGEWATHDGRYRGNWSPYIPRNVILKYTEPGDIVLDYFVGGGTTAIEAKLLGRRCIARDINPACISLTKENLNFEPPLVLFGKYFEPEVSVGDARDLSDIEDNSIDLICAHPPYAGIISYSTKIEGDLSQLTIEEFLKEMEKVAHESYRVLKIGGKCAILIGDTRKRKHVVPIGFQIIDIFLKAGFKLRELIIKRQHNCKTTGFWYDKSIRYNFLLLAHEYLPIFEKPKMPLLLSVSERKTDYGRIALSLKKPALKSKLDVFETTTVWIFPDKDFEERLNKNVIDRYSNGGNYSIITFILDPKNKTNFRERNAFKKNELLFIKSRFPENSFSLSEVEHYLKEIKEVVNRELPNISKGGFLAIQTKDVRVDGYIEPLAKRVVDILTQNSLWLKEIIIVTKEREKAKEKGSEEYLEIVHQYLLVYNVNR